MSVENAPFRPPVPPVPDQILPTRDFLRGLRTNALGVWPRAAYEQDYVLRTFMGRTNATLTSPEAIRHVLIDNAANYRRSPAATRILRPVAGNGLLLSQGEDWKLQRRTIAPALAPRMIPMLSRHIVSSVEATLATLRAQVGQPIDLLAVTQHLALTIVGRSIFSLGIEGYGAELRRLMVEFAEKHAQPHLLDLLMPPSIPTPRDWDRNRFKKRWMHFIEGIMAERMRRPLPEEPEDLFDLLRAARDPETGARFSSEQLRDQAATMILAGHETTALALFWALILLAQTPDEQEWLAEEVGVIEVGTVATMMDQLVRTRAVVNEALRLFPPAYLVVREAIKVDQIGSLTLPRRTLAMIPPWVVHRHRRYWHDPDAFIPTRFMPIHPAPDRFGFLPFGTGARICVGAQFAMAEAILALAMIIKTFRVTRPDDRPVIPVGIVTTKPDHPATVTLGLR